MSAGLKIRGLVVARGGKEVIRGVDLDIPPGQITALLGANGAGKSSIVLATVGALPVTSGEVTVDGTSIRGMRPEYVRRLGVAAVPEGHHVLSDLTVADNLKAAGYDEGQIAEIIAHTALNIFTNYFNNTAKVIVDFPQVELTH